MELKGFQRRYLTKLAHDLKPSVMIGVKGLTEAVIRQTDDMLEHHELIKVKFIDYKSSKELITQKLCEFTDAEIIRITGNIASLYRMGREPEHRRINLPEKKD